MVKPSAMPPQPSKLKAYNYAERIRARLPRRLQESMS